MRRRVRGPTAWSRCAAVAPSSSLSSSLLLLLLLLSSSSSLPPNRCRGLETDEERGRLRTAAEATGNNESAESSASCSKFSRRPTTTLSNGRCLPLVGMGVGNSPRELLDDVVSTNLVRNSYRLIDTARASGNERAIADAIAASSETFGHDDDDDENAVHVVTKVWYTHLGYDRTRLSVSESVRDLTPAAAAGDDNDGGGAIPQVRVHVLLHWPRCYDEVPWMRCEQEEAELPERVRSAGPPPHENKDRAWKESWRALEDAYLEDEEERERRNDVRSTRERRRAVVVESIGVSNFELADLRELLATARVTPHVYQGNLWSVLHDAELTSLLREHRVHVQAYNVMNGVLSRRSEAPNAYAVLTRTAADLTESSLRRRRESSSEVADDGRLATTTTTTTTAITEATVLLRWLAREEIGTIPRASSERHGRENSPASIGSVVDVLLTSDETTRVRRAISALLRGRDLTVEATFRNGSSGPVAVHWKNLDNGGEEIRVMDSMRPGDSRTISTHPGHQFVVYSEDKKSRQHFGVTASYGDEEVFHFGEL